MVGGIRPSAGVVLPLLPPALLHYTINRRKLQAVRQKICAKKVKMLGGCALRGTGSPCRCGKLNGGLAPTLPARRASAIPGGGLARLVACLPCLWFAFLPPIPPPALAERSSPVGKGETKVIFMQGASPLASPGGWAGCGTGSGWDAASGGGLPRAARASQFGFSKPGRSG